MPILHPLPHVPVYEIVLLILFFNVSSVKPHFQKSRGRLAANWVSAPHLRLRATPAEIRVFGAVEDFRLKDLRAKIYPQSGPNCAIKVEDIVTVVIDEAVTVDSCSKVRIAAGRPQPPPAQAIVALISTPRVTICRSPALPRAIRTEIPVHFRGLSLKRFKGQTKNHWKQVL